jgi:hypothetical protein
MTYLRFKRIYISFSLAILLFHFISCQTTKNHFVKDNYIYSVMLFNKNLGISAQLFGDMNLIDSSLVDRKKIKSLVKGIKELKNKKIIAYLKTNAEPDYETILIYDSIKKPIDTISRTELIFNDLKNNRIVYKKSKKNKVVYLLLKPKKIDNHDYFSDAKILIDKVTFDNKKLDKTTYADVFFGEKDDSNYLIARKSLKTKLLSQSFEQKWNQYQFLTTINSFLSNNSEFDSIVNKNATGDQSTIDSLRMFTKFENKDSVYKKIKEITKDQKVVMLNETHWLPKHRMFAFEMLDILKENKFNYLAIEAIEKKKDSLINLRGFPSKKSGYYTQEPYFAHFIRKALSLGFKIVSYDDYDSNNRELCQANNLKKIIDKDPSAKMFVYAGVAHILESDTSKKWMAEYFKEITNINPLTFCQDKITAKTDEPIVLIPSKDLLKVGDLNTNVDYFILNNLKPSLKLIFPDNKFGDLVVKSKKLKKKEIFIRVYNQNEYKILQKNAIPIFITAVYSDDSFVKINLPKGTYFISILSDKNEIIYDDYAIL